MARDPATSTPPPVPSVAGIRRLAGVSALAMIVVGTPLAMSDGLPLPTALIAATGGAAAGLAGWTAYHLIGRRLDGLIMVSTFMVPMLNRHGRPVGVAETLAQLIIAIGCGSLFGLWSRRWDDARRWRPEPEGSGPVAPPPPAA